VDARLDPAGVVGGLRADGDRDDRTVADGIILQLADPDLCAGSSAGTGRGDGRGTSTRLGQVQSAAPAHVGPRDVGRERTRWFPASCRTTSSIS
jgi:hypothetical protein